MLIGWKGDLIALATNAQRPKNCHFSAKYGYEILYLVPIGFR